MGKFLEGSARLFQNVYVCRNCKIKVRSTPQKIMLKKIVCKRCGKRAFRAIKKTQQKVGVGG